MSDPKADCQTLVDALLPVAEKMLTLYGEFHPFGGAMRPDGELVSISGYEGDEHPRASDVIALIKAGLITGAQKGDYKATAIAHDVRVKLPSADDMSDAIAVSLDHRDGYSVVAFFPYTINDGNLTLGTALAQKGLAEIFSA